MRSASTTLPGPTVTGWIRWIALLGALALLPAARAATDAATAEASAEFGRRLPGSRDQANT